HCPFHKDERLTLFCDELSCRYCVINSHQDHKYNFTSNIIDREKEVTKAKIKEVKDKEAGLSQ
ncbi:predicted protein, partial [Nematostella vectensis]